IIFFYFFFSSRRRHTRFSRDWSSDVCSSDLEFGMNFVPGCDLSGLDFVKLAEAQGLPARLVESVDDLDAALAWTFAQSGPSLLRSEERRVGKECRSWGALDHSNKKRYMHRTH